MSLFGVLAAFLGAALVGSAAEGEPMLGARDVFRAARDRFYNENPEAKADDKAPEKTPETPQRKKPETDRRPDPKPQADSKPRPESKPRTEPRQEQAPVYRPVVDAPLGLRYALLRQTSKYEADEVDVDTVFHSGDRIKIQLESSDMAYLYILAKGSSGRWRVLFPSAEIAGGAHQVRPDEQYMVPPRGWFAFDDQAGEEKVFVMLSRSKVNDLETLIGQLRDGAAPAKAVQPQPAAPKSDAPMVLAMHMAGARDLVFEKVDDSDAGADSDRRPAGHEARAEKAAYVVTKSGGPDSRVVAELTLKHR
ncbi:MAG: DUF4384 domain-containing protein [Acidobacteria bacterium]|nr:DUF4384 domain-containing protein [Acidobacteriota bacterium]